MALYSAQMASGPMRELLSSMRIPQRSDLSVNKSPVIVSDKKVYYCQRCLNHQRAEPRKNHKCDCPYASCTCEFCILVEKRRELNTKLQELEGSESVEIQSPEKPPEDDEEDKALKTKERIPNCQKCGQHGRKSRLKGHKRVCPFKDCPCFKCHLVTDRQKLMAEQIKIRRRQRKDHLMNMTREQITSTLNAAAALSAAGNFTFNPLIFQENQLPCSLLTSPAASSDGSSYSPTNVINQPFRTSPDLMSAATPTSTATVAPVTTGASATIVSAANAVSAASSITSPSPPSPQGILAPVAINPAFSFPLFNSEALIQLLASYKILDPAAPTLKSDHSQEKMDLSNPIIDVCSV